MQALSLGYDCKVAYPIRRWTSLRAGVAEPSFFEWLMTPAAVLVFVLGSDADLLRSGRWELINGDSSLRVLDIGLMFMHEFPSAAVEGGVNLRTASWPSRSNSICRRLGQSSHICATKY